MPERNFVGCEVPDDLLERIDEFCKKNDRKRSYVLRKGIELFLDVFDSYQKKQESGQKIEVKDVSIPTHVPYNKISEEANNSPEIVEDKINETVEAKDDKKVVVS